MTVLIYIYLPIGSTGPSTTITTYHTMEASTTVYVHMVCSQPFSFWVVHLPWILARAWWFIVKAHFASIYSWPPCDFLRNHQPGWLYKYWPLWGWCLKHCTHVPIHNFYIESSVNKLANSPFQATTTELTHWLARRIPQYGGPNDRFWKCGVRGLRCFTFAGDPQLQS